MACWAADWGRAAGLGSDSYAPDHYDPTKAGACPSKPSSPFYSSIDPTIEWHGPYDTVPDDKCVVKACGKLSHEPMVNCIGAHEALLRTIHMQSAVIEL